VALGAKAADVFRIVLTSTGTSVGTGLAAGLALSFAFDKIATKWLAESLRAPLTLAGATLLFLTAALLASIVPARRASTVDPMISLRYE